MTEGQENSGGGGGSAQDLTQDAALRADAFYRGVIIKLDRGKGWGIVRSHSGRELLFQFPLVMVIGARPGGKMAGMELLAEGQEVGFDVTRTANGMRVTTLKPAGAA